MHFLGLASPGSQTGVFLPYVPVRGRADKVQSKNSGRPAPVTGLPAFPFQGKGDGRQDRPATASAAVG
jgi:hypothetical protein